MLRELQLCQKTFSWLEESEVREFDKKLNFLKNDQILIITTLNYQI